MRQHAGGLNRAWLTVVGIVCVVAGALAASIALGLLGRGLSASGAPVTADPVLPPGASAGFDQLAVVAAVGVVGLVLGVLGPTWLLAQIPRTNAAKPFRLHDDAVRGLTVIDPAVLTAAVEDDVAALPGVIKAGAVLRGTAHAPELTLQITANDRTNILQLLQSLQTQTATHLATAMGSPVKHLAAQIDITTTRRTADHVTL